MEKRCLFSLIEILLLTFIISLNILKIESCFSKSSNIKALDVDTVPFNQTGCGVQQIQPNLRADLKIINGDQTKANSWPWTVSIRLPSSSGSYSHICGGSLISEQFVLTAAHCVEWNNLYKYAIIVGINSLSESLTSDNTFKAANIKKHSGYKSSTLKNDIAIIKLTKPVTYSSKVAHICIPESSEVDSVNSKSLYAVGWGSTDGYNAQGSLSKNLLQGMLNVLNGQGNGECSKYESANYCVLGNNGNTNICFGDSGGPLMYYSDNKWKIFGVTSFVNAYTNPSRCRNNLPSFFTKVPNYNSWIYSNAN